MRTSPQLSWITWSDLAHFQGCQECCGIVPNGPTSLVSFNICQGLKCKHVTSTTILTMWLLCSNCTLPWTTKFLVYSKRQILHNVHWGINPSPLPQKHHPLFLAKPPLNLQIVQAHLKSANCPSPPPPFKQSPPIYWPFTNLPPP